MLVSKVRTDMNQALKDGNKEKKIVLSLLVAALDNGAKEKKSELNESEENQIVLKLMKQIQETIDTCPSDRTDIKAKSERELAAISVYAPQMMNENEINQVITNVLSELGITNPTVKDKGRIMKELMPRVKGKADGKLVNSVLESRF